jgi:hypothetical protein
MPQPPRRRPPCLPHLTEPDPMVTLIVVIFVGVVVLVRLGYDSTSVIATVGAVAAFAARLARPIAAAGHSRRRRA